MGREISIWRDVSYGSRLALLRRQGLQRGQAGFEAAVRVVVLAAVAEIRLAIDYGGAADGAYTDLAVAGDDDRIARTWLRDQSQAKAMPRANSALPRRMGMLLTWGNALTPGPPHGASRWRLSRPYCCGEKRAVVLLKALIGGIPCLELIQTYVRTRSPGIVARRSVEYEDLRAAVGLDVVGAHHGDYPPPRELGDLRIALLAHRLSKFVPDHQPPLGAAFFDQRSLALGQCLFEHDQDDIVSDRGPRFRWAPSGLVADQAHDCVGHGHRQRGAGGAL